MEKHLLEHLLPLLKKLSKDLGINNSGENKMVENMTKNKYNENLKNARAKYFKCFKVQGPDNLTIKQLNTAIASNILLKNFIRTRFL